MMIFSETSFLSSLWINNRLPISNLQFSLLNHSFLFHFVSSTVFIVQIFLGLLCFSFSRNCRICFENCSPSIHYAWLYHLSCLAFIRYCLWNNWFYASILLFSFFFSGLLHVTFHQSFLSFLSLSWRICLSITSSPSLSHDLRLLLLHSLAVGLDTVILTIHLSLSAYLTSSYHGNFSTQFTWLFFSLYPSIS